MKNIAISFAIGAALTASVLSQAQNRWEDQHDREAQEWRHHESAHHEMRVFIDDNEVHFKPEERPFWANHALMVPFRTMGDLLGAKTDRSRSGERLHVVYRNNDVEFTQGDEIYRRNGARFHLQPTIGKDGVLFVPVKLWEFVRKGHVHVKFIN